MIRFALVAFLVAIPTCQPAPPAPVPPKPIAMVDSGACVDQPDTECGRACRVMCSNLCIEAMPTPMGEPCWSVCENNSASGFALLPVSCIESATSKAALQRCGVCK